MLLTNSHVKTGATGLVHRVHARCGFLQQQIHHSRLVAMQQNHIHSIHYHSLPMFDLIRIKSVPRIFHWGQDRKPREGAKFFEVATPSAPARGSQGAL